MYDPFNMIAIGLTCVGLGWCLAWMHYDKYGSVGAPFVRRDWPRKPTVYDRKE